MGRLLRGAVALCGLQVVAGLLPATAEASKAESPRPAGLLGQIPGEVLQLADQVRDRPLPERIEAVSEALLGRPYAIDPLGEGVPPDPDPFARYDVFDCLTYTEEVLALTLAGDPAHAAQVRNSLRYGAAAPAYATRHHFMELQWIPAAIANGWLVDTTAEYGEPIRLEREVDRSTWSGWNKRGQFALSDDQLPVGTMRLDVLPLQAAQEVADRIRPGSVLLTVREDRPWVPLWVTHVGFVVSGEVPTFRHATKIGDGGTRDHALSWYLKHVETYGPWRTLGIAVLEPVEQGPRTSGLPRRAMAPGPVGTR